MVKLVHVQVRARDRAGEEGELDMGYVQGREWWAS